MGLGLNQLSLAHETSETPTLPTDRSGSFSPPDHSSDFQQT